MKDELNKKGKVKKKKKKNKNEKKAALPFLSRGKPGTSYNFEMLITNSTFLNVMQIKQTTYAVQIPFAAHHLITFDLCVFGVFNLSFQFVTETTNYVQ